MSTPEDARRESDLMMPEGLQAGLIGGLGVIGTYLVPDLLAGDWLRTPSLLGRFLLYGGGGQEAATSDGGLAMLFTLVHFAAWAIAGFAASMLIQAVETRPHLRRLPLVSLLAWIAVMVGFDIWLAMHHLPVAHLWAGSVVGACVLGAYLVWRHPSMWTPQGETSGTSR